MTEAAERKKNGVGVCLRRKSRHSQPRGNCSGRVHLDKVFGITTLSNSGLTSDPNSGLIAYPAGCVVVLLHPLKNQQSHIVNTSRKPFSALAFSPDGKHLVTGESGHMPCVRVWEVGGVQVAEVQSHKYGISCVAFSTNGCYIVSVGYQHDMTVSVWDWRKGTVIASNKVSSRVSCVSFSQDSSYFVTAGNRHVKFWYLDASKDRRVNSTVPLIGRSGLLGDHKNTVFSGVACGRGIMVSSTYCITSSGLLCRFNSSRQLEMWVDLKTTSAGCLVVSEEFIFCGCADGVIRVFSPSNLQYITTLHRPHRLGVDLQTSHMTPAGPGAQYPNTLALTFVPSTGHLTCVYSDHSVYVWNTTDMKNMTKMYSALYHSSRVWSLEVYPELSEPSQGNLPPSSFLTCSSDNTIRLWHMATATVPANLYSNDLLRIVYVGENMQHLQDEGDAAGADGKVGIRVLRISPDGQHLAAGDRCGNLRIFGLQFLDELVKIEAHDSEVLCLEFSPISTGVKLLASASRDRLIHVFDLDKNYSLMQTLNDHSASITAVRFTGESPEVRMVSCGADKSIYVQAAEQTAEGLVFSRSHHVVEKTTLYDMDLDVSRTHVAIACQDRNVRVYSVHSGKLQRCLQGSSTDEGAPLKVHMDPSGTFFATSCSDKTICIFEYESGECVATLFGHSEIVTCMRFSQDCRHLITVSGDSCVFVWRLDSHMTNLMRKRQGLRKLNTAANAISHKHIRRETFITVPSAQLPQMEEEEEAEEADVRTPGRLDSGVAHQVLQSNGKLPTWLRKLQEQGQASSTIQSDTGPRQLRGRWVEQMEPLIICSSFSPSPTKSPEEEEEVEAKKEGQDDDFHPQSLESVLRGQEEEADQVDPAAGELGSRYSLYNNSSTSNRKFNVEGCPEVRGQEAEPMWSSEQSVDSEGSAGSLDQHQDGDSDSQGSSVDSLVLGQDDDGDTNSLKNYFDTLSCSLTDERFDTDLQTLEPPDEKHFLNPRLSISTRFLSRFQDRLRLRAWPSRAPPCVSVPTRILEESSMSNASVSAEPSVDVFTESNQKPDGKDISSRSHSDLQGMPQLRCLGTTAVSSLKENPDALSPNVHSTRPEPCMDRSSLLVLAPHTELMSPGGGNAEDTLIVSPAPSLTPTAPPTVCDLIPCSTSSQEDQSGLGKRTQLQTIPASDLSLEDDESTSAPRTSSSCSPMSDRLHPHPGDVDESVSVQAQQIANDLRQTTRRAVDLYRQLCGSGSGPQSLPVLLEAFVAVQSDLGVVLQEEGTVLQEEAAGGCCPLDNRMTSLLEKYSELLLQMTQNKVNLLRTEAQRGQP